jgi:ABC-2 type transport system permease protein
MDMEKSVVKTKVASKNQSSIPSDFQQFLFVVRYETLKYLRSRRLIAIIIILALIIGLILAVPPALGYDYPSDPLDFAGRFIGFASILIILCVTFFGADAIVSEFQHKTGYLLFPNPLKRSVILIGKFSASFLSSMLVILIFYGSVIISTTIITQSLKKEIGYSFIFAIIFLLSALSVTYLISSIMKGTTGATVLTFFLFFLIFSIIESVFTFAKVKPWASLSFSSNIISTILVVPYPSDNLEGIPIGGGQTIPIYYPEIALSLLVMFFYLVIAFALTYFIFSRKEMK